MTTHDNTPAGLSISAPISPDFATILTPQALAFFAKLARTFEPRRQTLFCRKPSTSAMAIGLSGRSPPIYKIDESRLQAPPIARW